MDSLALLSTRTSGNEPIAFAASSFAIAYAEVFAAKWMTPLAVRLPCLFSRWRTASQYIFSISYRFKMVRVKAAPMAARFSASAIFWLVAGMIQIQIIRDWAYEPIRKPSDGLRHGRAQSRRSCPYPLGMMYPVHSQHPVSGLI